jgi:TonB family protein
MDTRFGWIETACLQPGDTKCGGVNPTPVLRLVLLASALAFSLVPRLAAQNILLGEYEGKAYPVRFARVNGPFVEVGGKMVGANLKRLGLNPVDEYLPAFISIHGLRVSSFHLETTSSQINNEFRFEARFESGYNIPNVFLVLELTQDREAKQLFLYEVGELQPGEPKSLRLVVPVQYAVGAGHCKIHLFSDGLEVLHSQNPPERREAVMDRIIKKRIAGVQDAEAKIFCGPPPEFPESLLKAKTKGQAVIALQISANGRVADPGVKSATDPAFGVAALEAVKLWRFMPKVKNGRAVGSRIEIPIDFSPPGRTEEKS